MLGFIRLCAGLAITAGLLVMAVAIWIAVSVVRAGGIASTTTAGSGYEMLGGMALGFWGAVCGALVALAGGGVWVLLEIYETLRERLPARGQAWPVTRRR